ncbi:MAG: phosphotransferase family protein [bacterium]
MNVDGTRPVRKGEELDAAKLEAYLRTALPELGGALTIEQFPGGHSNLTYALRIGERELVLRRPPFGPEIKTAHDMGREYRILSGLIREYPKVPRPLLYCEDRAVMGAPFYVMERVRGVILRNRTAGDLAIAPDQARRMSEALVDNLAAIHGVSLDATGLASLGKPAGYVGRQVKGWTERYANSRTDDIPEIERAAAWLAERMPPESGAALIHNDYKYDNVVLDPADVTRIVAVLDWEMATIGDPWMDLGTSLSLWVDRDDPEPLQMAAFGPTLLEGGLDRVGVVERYAQASGRPVDDPLYYFVFGLFKMAVVLQQIYKRYVTGFSKDERFAMMIHLVRMLAQMADRAIQLRRIDKLG